MGLITGLTAGGFSCLLSLGVKYGTAFRGSHPWILYLLPAAGLIIVFLYRLCGFTEDKGTNLVIQSVQSGDHLPWAMAPLILVSTVITHLFGGSSGRESAGLQIGGSIGHNIGKLIGFAEEDQKTITVCGMSAAFAALFGTPMTAAFFAMELESVGIMYYASLIPCVVSALVASTLAKSIGLMPEIYAVKVIPELSAGRAAVTVALAALCAGLSFLFCITVHESGKLQKKYIENPYLRIAAGGALVVGITLLLRTRVYNGASLGLIEASFTGEAPYEAFILKLLLTAITLGAGFKGGEIVPSLCIGACFGCTFSRLSGFDPGLCSAVGMTAMFCGVTNCPISSLLISFELFGYEGMPYYLLAVAFSYALSGYHGLYSSQKIMYSKFHHRYVNRDTE